ncbi:MAG TPA: hypothetical protein VFR29_06380 [Steroidobacteraceae bacterium]|nr:hypothetical protein [Steroidobacteraceae bacterium]
MTTIPFGPRRDDDELMTRASELPQEIAPARDLWPGIAARLGEEPLATASRGVGWPAALAAGFLVAAVSALLTWGLLREPEPAAGLDTQLAGEPAVLPVSYGPNSALGAEQLAARDQLLPEFRRRFELLAPATQQTVLANLAVIQQAADEIDAALAEDPASGLLNELLVGTYRQELELYSKLVTAGDGSTRRT